MAFDGLLADRVRTCLQQVAGVSEMVAVVSSLRVNSSNAALVFRQTR